MADIQIKTSNHYVFAFDVDHTLEVSNGPIPIRDLEILKGMGHVVGLCGNYAMVTMQVPTWKLWCNFFGPGDMTKIQMLNQIKTYVPAQNYYLVGNDGCCKVYKDKAGDQQQISKDHLVAKEVSWDFILEDDWKQFFLDLRSDFSPSGLGPAIINKQGYYQIKSDGQPSIKWEEDHDE